MDIQHQKLRVGLVINDGPQPQVIVDFIQKSMNAEHYFIEKILVKRNAATQCNISVKKKIEGQLFQCIKKIEQTIIPKNKRIQAYLNLHSINALPLEKDFLSDFNNKTSKDDVFDLLVLSHDVQLEAHFLSFASQGVVMLDQLSAQKNLVKVPFGFDEVLSQRPSTTFLIQHLRANQQCKTLYKGKVYTANLFLLNQMNVIERAYYSLHQTLEQFNPEQLNPAKFNHARSENKHAMKQHEIFQINMQAPDFNQQILYFFKTFLHLLKKKSWKLRKIAPRWGVAYQFTDDWQHVNLTQSTVIKNPPNHFLADPFIVTKNGQHYCFVEDLDYATNKGKIAVYQISQNGVVALGTALEEDFHLSYPYIFEADGKLYMCPETYQAHEIRLYECVDFPLQWKKHKVLKSNVSAADTNIFQWNHQWWMLTNIDSLGHDEHHNELHLFYADRFDATDWQAHPQNPVIFDPLKARNGGLLFKNNEIYRVFQQHGFDNYGESMGIAKITALNTQTYAEELLYKIPADFFSGLSGAHSYAFAQGLLAIDFKKLEKTKN